MREISAQKITDVVAELCVEANYILNDDVYSKIKESMSKEISPIGKDVLGQLIKNADMAKQKQTPICQDTGMTVVFMEIGQDAHITGGSLERAINDGVRKGYGDGYLRKSIVKDPFLRENTRDNTPAVIHYTIVDGENVDITVAPKGFGSENMSRVFMLKPSQGIEGAKEAVIKAVDEAGANPCPPMIVGVGIGGNFESCALMAKRALLRPVGSRSELEHIRKLEDELLEKINALGIGPQGFGGVTTALAVNIETAPTHIAGMPVAVNISCHVTRHAHRRI